MKKIKHWRRQLIIYVKSFIKETFRKKEKKEAAYSDREFKLYTENTLLKNEVAHFKREKKALEKPRPIIDANIGDPAPEKEEDRKLYVAQVAAFHKDYFSPKIKQMISTAHRLLESTDNDRDYDLELKGAIYAFWELHKWGEVMVNEQIANQTEEKDK